MIIALFLLGIASHSSVSFSTIIHDGIISFSQAKLVGKEYRALSDERRQKYIDDARLSISSYDEELLELTSSAFKKSKSMKEEDEEYSEEEEDEEYSEEEESVVSTTPSSLSDIDYTNDEEEFDEELDDGNAGRSIDSDIAENRQKNKPKRPLNGYFLFACEIRDQVRAANPHLTGSKIVSIIVFAYAVCFVFFVSTVSNATIFHSLDV